MSGSGLPCTLCGAWGGGGQRNYDLNFFLKKLTISRVEKIQGG